MWELDFPEQIKAFFCSIALGGALSFVYDINRSIRFVVKNKKAFIFITDIAFSIFLAFVVFVYFLIFTNGKIRGYILLGVLIGFLLERLFISKYIVSVLKKVFIKIKSVYEGFLCFKNKIVDKIFQKAHIFFCKIKIFIKKDKKALKI